MKIKPTKIICLTCCFIMLAALAGCGEKEPSSDTPQETTIAQSTIAQSTTEQTTTTETPQETTSDVSDVIVNENATELDKIYSDALENMSKIKSYHSEQDMQIKIKADSGSGAAELPNTLKTSADISDGKTADGKDAIYIHSISTMSLFGFEGKTETYSSENPDVDNEYFEFYQKQETSALAQKPKWVSIPNTESKSNIYVESFPKKIDDIKINEKESAGDIVVLEGNTDAAADMDSLKSTFGTTGNVKYATKVKVKIDKKQKTIIEISLSVKADGKAESGNENHVEATITQKNTKINENINVKIPDSVKKEAKATSNTKKY